MLTQSKRTPKDKPFPWRCPHCGKQEVVRTRQAYSTKVNLDGALYAVTLPNLEVPKCSACGELLFDDSADDQINEALRAQLGLLRPEQISQNRNALQMTKGELANCLGVSEQTLADWETGIRIQTRSADNLLRLFFAIPDVRGALIGRGRDPQLGDNVSPPSFAG